MPGFDPSNLGGMMAGMQQKMQSLQAEAAATEVSATAGNGLVTVVATGAQEIVAVRIQPAAMEDRELLEDLVAAATNEALRRSKEAVANRLAELASAMGLPPGLLG